MTGERQARRTIDAAPLDDLSDLVAQAALAVLAVKPGDASQRLKADRTVVTAADERSDAIIAEGLARILPGVPVVSEESLTASSAARSRGGLLAMVDPLDGTREFLEGRPEYAINLALIEDGLPVAGIVALPALGRLYRGVVGAGAERIAIAGGRQTGAAMAIRAREHPQGELTALVSRSHLDPETAAFVERFAPVRRVALGSALKFCRLAEGAADLYPRLSPTREWDVAAGHALLAAAGGCVLRPGGEPLAYGGAPAGDFGLPGFIALGDPRLAARLAQGSGTVRPDQP